jgi:hypothetical protein
MSPKSFFRARLLIKMSLPRSLRTSVSKNAYRSYASKRIGIYPISHSSLPIADKLHPSSNLQLGGLVRNDVLGRMFLKIRLLATIEY